MLQLRGIVVVLGTISCVHVPAEFACAEVYRDAKRHLSFTIPKGWQIQSAARSAQIRKAYEAQDIKNMLVILEPSGTTGQPRSYIVAVFENFKELPNSVTLAEDAFPAFVALTQKDYGDGFRVADENASLPKTPPLGEIRVNKKKHQLKVRTQSSNNAESHFYLGMMTLGRLGVLSFDCLGENEVLEEYANDFAAIQDSVRLDPGFEYKPIVYELEPEPDDTGNYLVMFLFVLVIAAVVGFTVWSIKKPKRRLKPRVGGRATRFEI